MFLSREKAIPSAQLLCKQGGKAPTSGKNPLSEQLPFTVLYETPNIFRKVMRPGVVC